MSESIKEKILKNIVTTLEGVTKAAGYDFDLRQVSRIPINPFDLTTAQLPAVIVSELAEDKTELGAYPRVDVVMQVVLTCCNYKFHNVSEKASELLANIEKAMSVDRTRGGFAYDTDIIRNNIIFSGDTIPYGGVLIELMISYRHSYGNPFAQV